MAWIAPPRVPHKPQSAAIRRCRELAEYNELRGDGRCTFCGVILNKSGKSYRCIFEREIEE
ncbi:hypothetical protein [Microcoleus sp.]|uniref:hypothetical protein n=1 Tax=Microcoleus sp. TaxID=44472 RepID=UPI003525CECA